MPSSITTLQGYLTELKAKSIRKQLAGRVGIVVRAKDGLAIGIKSPDVIQIMRRPDKRTLFFLWGIAGSFSERRDFYAELMQFEGLLKNVFSERDYNLYLVHDFVTSLLKEKFHGGDPRPAALEFFLGGVLNDEALLLIINFEGTSRTLELERGGNFEIIGCTGFAEGRSEKDKLEEQLARLKLTELSAKEVQAYLETIVLEPFPGPFLSSILVPHSSLARKKKGRTITS